MKTANEVLLGILLNACWQIALITAVAVFCSWLLRATAARYRHMLWVATLLLSFSLPILTSPQVLTAASPFRSQLNATEQPIPQSIVVINANQPVAPVVENLQSSPVRLGQTFAAALVFVYLLILIFRTTKLLLAWKRTTAITRTAGPIQAHERVQAIIADCRVALGVGEVTILSSAVVPVPITVGIRRPFIILPDKLLNEVDSELIKSGIGHELIHVYRRDYLLNLIYELILLPLSFHPAAALIRRRISQTRELSCDELVAEKLQNPRVYARSLVQLATSAPQLRHLTATTTVGIANADNLEVRVMSLLKTTKLNVRQKTFLLITAALLLLIPCVAAASFPLTFEVDQEGLSDKSAAQRENEEKKLKVGFSFDLQEQKQAREREERERAEREAAEGQVVETKIRREREELEMRNKRQAELAKLARISMDQAIQIATGKYPGTVTECSLVGEHWDDTESKPLEIFYHVVIVSPDDPKILATHVWVSATDGRIIKTEKEETREEKSELEAREPISGGMLNSHAISLPKPEYPAIARAAGAEGTVTVAVVIDELGNVISAKAIAGHPLLQSAAVNASREAKFSPTRLEGEPVRVRGMITYNFVKQ